MSPPETATPDSGTGGADYLTTTNTPKDGTGITTTDASAFGVMMDRPLTTTRTCAGRFCWCHVGADVGALSTEARDNFYWDHRQYMDALAVRIRRLDVEQGVQA